MLKKINVILFVAVICLSVFSIIWHHQMFLLHKELTKVKKINNELTATNKQLSSQYATEISGAEIISRTTKELKMIKYKKIYH